MKDGDLLRGLTGTREDVKTVVETIAQRVDPKSQPRDYADAIYGAVKRFVGQNDLSTALAIVEVSGSNDVSPALHMIGQKYASKKDFPSTNISLISCLLKDSTAMTDLLSK